MDELLLFPRNNWNHFWVFLFNLENPEKDHDKSSWWYMVLVYYFERKYIWEHMNFCRDFCFVLLCFQLSPLTAEMASTESWMNRCNKDRGRNQMDQGSISFRMRPLRESPCPHQNADTQRTMNGLLPAHSGGRYLEGTMDKCFFFIPLWDAIEMCC